MGEKLAKNGHTHRIVSIVHMETSDKSALWQILSNIFVGDMDSAIKCTLIIFADNNEAVWYSHQIRKKGCHPGGP